MARGRGQGDLEAGLRQSPGPLQDPSGFRMWWQTLDNTERQLYEWPEHLDYADLSELDLSHCDFSNRSLYGANLYKANCVKTNFIGADLHDANLELAVLTDAIFEEDAKGRLNVPLSDEIVEGETDNIRIRTFTPRGWEAPAEIRSDPDTDQVLYERFDDENGPIVDNEHPCERSYSPDGILFSETYQIADDRAEEGSYAKLRRFTDEGKVFKEEYIGHPEGLLERSYNDGRTVETYEPTDENERLIAISVQDGVKTYHYQGYDEWSREDGPVMRTVDINGNEKLTWAWQGDKFQDEERWREAIIGPLPMI